ncbi:permease PerM [gamma proteobacterium HTCC5015]|nr:permease PerM [gamma proteobacterium HTCC5015]
MRAWYQRHFSDPRVVSLALLLLGGLALILLVGDILAPLLAAMILTYLLEGVVLKLQAHHFPRLLAVVLVLLGALGLTLFLLLGLVPLLSNQITELIRELPHMVGRAQTYLLTLPTEYPELFNEQQMAELIDSLRGEIGSLGQSFVSFSIASAGNLITFGIYLILVPTLMFFMLKDKAQILDWMRGFMPDNRSLIKEVWHEVDIKIGNYVRGKFIEIGIIWAVSYATFFVMGLNYALLLSALVGVSVIIPYIGAIAVTIPVALIAFFQWGVSAELLYLLIAYQVIQVLDGNVLVPVLFSEVVNLHPVAIIAAVVFFGGIWGAWGVFFAIPLATLVQAVLKAWPKFTEAAQAAEEG